MRVIEELHRRTPDEVAKKQKIRPGTTLRNNSLVGWNPEEAFEENKTLD